MTVELLLAIVTIAVAFAVGSGVALAVATYRLRSAATLNKDSGTEKQARAALLSLLGIVVAAATLAWSYREFILLKGRY